MEMTYPFLLIRNAEEKVTHVLFPDLKVMFRVSEQTATREAIHGSLQNYIDKLIIDKTVVPLPKTIRDYQQNFDYKIEPNQFWSETYVNLNQNCGVLETLLPVLGTIAVIVSGFCNSAAVFVSVGLTTGDNDNNNGWGIWGAIVNLVMTTLVYFLTDTRSELASFGKIADDYLMRKKDLPYFDVVGLEEKIDSSGSVQSQPNPVESRWRGFYDVRHEKTIPKKLIALTLFFAVIALFDTGASSITDYQEINSLGMRATDTGRSIPNGLLISWAVIYSVSDAIAWATFELNFANKAAQKIANCITHSKCGIFDRSDQGPRLLSSVVVDSTNSTPAP